MSEQELAAIRRMADRIADAINEPRHVSMMEIEPLVGQYVPRLLAEVERLRAELERSAQFAENVAINANRTFDMAVTALQAENAALREIAQAAATDSWYTHSSTLGGELKQSACCPFPTCEQEADDSRSIPHTPDCPVTRARALLADAPTTR